MTWVVRCHIPQGVIDCAGVDETQTSPGLTDLSKLEQQVVNAARRGEVARPAATMTVEHLAVTDNPELQVGAGAAPWTAPRPPW